MSFLKDVVNELTDPLLAIPLSFAVGLGGLFFAAADLVHEENKTVSIEPIAARTEPVAMLKLEKKAPA